MSKVTKINDTKINEHLQIALNEIGKINPKKSEYENYYIFEHPNYPWVTFSGETIKETKEGYLRALKEFIKERLAGNITDATESTTTGHGGRREGAGRPSKPTATVRFSEDLIPYIQSNKPLIEHTIRAMQNHSAHEWISVEPAAPTSAKTTKRTYSDTEKTKSDKAPA